MSRRAARERAISILYEARIKEILPTEVLAGEGEGLADALTVRIVKGVSSMRGELDAQIAGHSISWGFERLPITAVCILEAAIWELIDGGLSAAVVIDEAVELAKTFGEPANAKFVNAVLSRVATELGRLPRPPEGSATE
ncbi:MAG: transcription antitermination factor NusB [Actinomycetota bacterium]|nr:transcription antitermination factor NusB [Actinomycetota bacterium]MDA8396736.1 transcription antitermination factor NusB [Actinomycetota bacterium]